ncbi:uncharacterized protein Z519_03063 [Cladophialophora bantiana CBS 173.52]|uniref:ATPase AAA-type core domain-containing protein n=1 Tax=Cladophialophora bantiana (strain ATCC 10958 / CBS 173.52 / CDC B-1940 / NIH 8579) TaxID=1442370 RepID=A0A0D2GBV1_CLAB1|nr:uncharacterized protein Z519_03063 [Cladophialophora bantiana CBS 173.52]KIW95997.1 hypothetical protein Z519_03063 [Cladophialophora bantiana CBS 173.52]
MPDLADDNKHWCVAEVARHKSVKTLNLGQHYYMEKSTKVKKPSTRAGQVATLSSAEALLGIPYCLLYGPRTGRGKKRPLVGVFAGASGHRKPSWPDHWPSPIARIEVVNCTTFKSVDELIGPRAPYNGSAHGSPLNNFLARKDGQSGIVFLDEFEKMSANIHDALLIPFDKGMALFSFDVDCSRMVWVLATNAIDTRIITFCEEQKAILLTDHDHVDRPVLIKKLSRVIKKEFKQQVRVRAASPF